VPEDRADFILRDWIAENGFGAPEKVVKGIHMFREGGKGFGKDFREIAEEHKREVEAVGKIYSEVLGMFMVIQLETLLILSCFIGGSMPTYVKAPKELRFGRPTRR
jgi:hypothetical protein